MVVSGKAGDFVVPTKWANNARTWVSVYWGKEVTEAYLILYDCSCPGHVTMDNSIRTEVFLALSGAFVC